MENKKSYYKYRPYSENPQIKEYQDKWRKEHSDYQKKWQKTHNGYLKKWRQDNPDNFKNWVMQNRERMRELAKLRELRIKNLAGSHTKEEWENKKKEYNFTCPSCGRKEPNIKLGKDHIIPISKMNATNYINNIQPLCKSCNSIKKNNTIKFEIK